MKNSRTYNVGVDELEKSNKHKDETIRQYEEKLAQLSMEVERQLLSINSYRERVAHMEK